MSFLENATINYEFAWVQADRSRGDTVILDNGSVDYSYLFDSGIGIGQVNAVWHATGILNVGEQKQFDLFALPRNIFGSVINTNLSGGSVKAIIVENLNTGVNQNIVFNNSGTAGFTAPFQTGNVYLNIAPESTFAISNKFGYPVSTGQRYFYLKDINYSGSIQYEIAIIGVAL